MSGRVFHYGRTDDKLIITDSPTTIRLLVFDLDGTLIDSSADLCSSVNAALHHVGCVELSRDVVTSFIGDGAAALLRRALVASCSRGANFPEPASLLDRAMSFFLQHYRDHKLDTTQAYPGVMDALRAIRARHPDLLMAVLTNKPVRPAREICAGLDLERFFFLICGGDSYPNKKPHPEGLLAIMQSANECLQHKLPGTGCISSSNVVVIGDSDVDVETARHAGVRSLGCAYGLAPEKLRSANPDFWCAHPSEWMQALAL